MRMRIFTLALPIECFSDATSGGNAEYVVATDFRHNRLTHSFRKPDKAKLETDEFPRNFIVITEWRVYDRTSFFKIRPEAEWENEI